MDNEKGAQQMEQSNAAANFDDGAKEESLASAKPQPDSVVFSSLEARRGPSYVFKPMEIINCEYTPREFSGIHPTLHRVVASESHLYFLGGYPLAPRQELWSYNFATNRWKFMLVIDNRHDMRNDVVPNALGIYHNVLIGHGVANLGIVPSPPNDCYVYTTNDKPRSFKLPVTGDLPLSERGAAIVIHDGYLYSIGGTTRLHQNCDVHRLNLGTKVWENVYISRPDTPEGPKGRCHHAVVCDGQHIYALGGCTEGRVFDFQRTAAFDLQAKQWQYFETLPDKAVIHGQDQETGYPKPRKYFACVQHKTSNGDVEAFISGGLKFNTNTYCSDIWRLNLRTKQWFCLPVTLPKPLCHLEATHAHNGCMYISGGIENVSNEVRRTNKLYKMWLTVPKLSEICWDAITYYNQNMDQYSTEQLLNAGIPERFEKRLRTASCTILDKSQHKQVAGDSFDDTKKTGSNSATQAE